MTTRERLFALSAWTILISVLVLPGVLGSLSSVVSLVFALGLVPLVTGSGESQRIREQPAMTLFLLAFALIAVLVAVDARDTLDLRFIANFIAFALAPLVYLASRKAPADSPLLVVALALVGAAATAVLAVAMSSLYGPIRAQGFFGGPNLMPRIVIPLGFVALAGVLLLRGPIRAVFYLGPVFAIIATVLSASRGGTLALAPLAVIAGVTLAYHKHTRFDLLILAVVTAAALAAMAIFYPLNLDRILSAPAGIWDVLTGANSADLAIAERQVLQSAGWRAFLDSPLIGHGWANLPYAAAAANPTAFGNGTMWSFHNDLLDFAVAGGVLGVAAYVLVILAPLAGALVAPRDGFRAVRRYVALVLSGSFLVFGLTDLTMSYDAPVVLYAFLTALFLGMPAPTMEER